MPSFAEAFPNAHVLLSLDPDQIAGLLLFIYRNLPWRNPRAIRRCVLYWAQAYPAEVRDAIVETLVLAWTRLDAENLLGAAPVGAPQLIETPYSPSRGIRLRA